MSEHIRESRKEVRDERTKKRWTKAQKGQNVWERNTEKNTLLDITSY